MTPHPYDNGELLYHENSNVEFDEDERYSWFEAHKQQYIQVIRNDRNQRLKECDWIVVKSAEQNIDVPIEWVEYRQALRDITNLYDKQSDVIWPNKPE